MKTPIRTILLIDDDIDDCALFAEALCDVNPSINLVCLNTTETVSDAILNVNPDLIFLDINMPKLDGFECLKMLYDSVTQFRMPIVMYSSSRNTKEINIAYSLGASLYLQKPSNYTKLMLSIRAILNMQWESPAEIKQQFFQNGNYYSYEV